MAIPALNPHIRHARAYMDFIIKSTDSRCYDCRLFYIKEGSGTLTVQGEKYHFSSDTTIFLPPASLYSFDMNSGDVCHLIFNFDLVSDHAHLEKSLGTAKAADFDPQKVPQYPIPKEFSAPIILKAPHLYESLKNCTEDFLNTPPYYREVCSARLKRCLLELLRSNEAEPESEVLRAITEYIHAHYRESTLTNEAIAAAFHYHPYYISQRIKAATGRTLHQTILDYRIRIAKNELITTDADIGTVAWRCGFNSTAYFIKQFKAHTGITPKQYRKKHIDSIY